jgi:hypothetical protein
VQPERMMLDTPGRACGRRLAERALALAFMSAALLVWSAMSVAAAPARAVGFADADVADLRLGTIGDGAYLGTSGTGSGAKLQLQPLEAQEFDGFDLPLSWDSATWAEGGTVSVGGGALVVDGARAGSVVNVGPNRAIEFVATFANASFQHVGVGVTYEAPPWAVFSTGGGSLPIGLYARTNGDSPVETAIHGVDPTVPHQYRIEWTASRVNYLVDDVVVATHDVAVPGPMRPLASDFEVGGASVTLYWLHMSPYAPAGTFTSRVFDAGAAVGKWLGLQASTTLPAGTQVQVQTRTGDGGQPDGTWSAWQDVGPGGEILSPTARYIQYRVQLSTNDPANTPAIRRVSIDYAPDVDPPAPPSRPDLEPASDSGAFQTDDVTRDSTPTFSGTAEDRSRVTILIDGAPSGSALAQGGNYEVSVAPLADGRHDVTAVAEDAAGNRSGASDALSMTVDTQAPASAILSVSRFADRAEFAFSADESGATFECRTDNNAFAPCTSPRPYAGLSPGPHTFSVRATDRAGNTEAAPPRRAFVINTPPAAGSVTLGPSAPTRVQTLTATPSGFTDADGDQLAYQYRWFDGATRLAATGRTLDLTQAGALRGDSIRVEVTAGDGNGGSAGPVTATTTVVNAPPQIDVSTAAATAQYSDAIAPLTIRATDVDGDRLSFTPPAGLPAGLTLTDNGDGTATISGRVLVASGTYQPVLTVSDGHGGTHTGTAKITVTPESADAGYTGTLFVATASATATSADVTMTGQLAQQADGMPGDPTQAFVDFQLYKSSDLATTASDQTCRAQVSASGALSCTIRALPADNWTVVMRTATDGPQYYKAVSDAVVLTVYQPSTDMHASGGGWIIDPGYQSLPVAISGANQHGNLGFTVRYKKGTTTPQGQAVYVFRGVDGYTYVVKSNSWTGGGLAFGTNAAGAPFTGFSGKANVTAFDSTGAPATGVGGGNMSYRVDVVDNATLGTPDSYAINVYTSTGKLYHQAGTQAAPIAVSGGNLTVRSR